MYGSPILIENLSKVYLINGLCFRQDSARNSNIERSDIDGLKRL